MALIRDAYEVGELVILVSGSSEPVPAIVSRAVTKSRPGEILVYDSGLTSRSVTASDIEPAPPEASGWAQLAHSLIALGSHIIEQRLIVYRK